MPGLEGLYLKGILATAAARAAVYEARDKLENDESDSESNSDFDYY